jgi:hypothetical protein
MLCERARDLLIEYLNETLDSVASGEVVDHLTSCKSCQKEADELKKVLNLLDLAEPPVVPEHFSRQVMATITSSPAWRERLTGLSALFPRPLPAFASLLLLVLCSALIVYVAYSPKKLDMTPREASIILSQPLLLKVDNIDAALVGTRAKLTSLGGRILADETTRSGMRLTIDLSADQEAHFLETLKSLGTLTIKGRYRDKEQHILLVLERK